MNLREAANIAWHIRVNGNVGVSKERFAEAAPVWEEACEEFKRYREREPLVQMLIRDVVNGDAIVKTTALAVRDFKVTP